jgi:PAS domain S-box-containing protein
MWQETPYTIPLVLVSALFIALGIYVWIHYRSTLGNVGSITVLASTDWILAYALKMASSDLTAKIFWKKMQYPGVVILPVAWLIFAVYYTGRERWVTRRTLALLLGMPVITLVLAVTNEYHGLVWSSFTLRTAGSYLVSDETFGLWLWGFIGYAYVLLLFGASLFFKLMMTCSHPLYRLQTSILIVGAMVPWAAQALVSFGMSPFPDIDLTLVALIMTNVTVLFNIFYFHLGDVVPLARETIFESMHDSVLILDTGDRIVDINSSARQLIGNTGKVKGRPVGEVWPAWHTAGLDDAEGGREIVLGDESICDVRNSPLVDWLDRTIGKVVVVRDVTDRKQSEEIRQSLREKEVLLQEIHHRVKNNIQIISSLLSLQSHYTEDKKYAEMLRESQDRIKSMALIHEKLYHSANLADIDLHDYITDLVHNLAQSYGTNSQDITFNIEGNASLGIDAAIPCGLIINELITNVFKHAFPDGKGITTITICSAGESVELIIGDNGIGIPDDVDFRMTESLGLHLVTILVENQLGGKISLDRRKGTVFHITFKVG